MDGVALEFRQKDGTLILRCNEWAFEELLEAMCAEAGVFVPVSVPVVPVSTLSVVLASEAPPPPVAWWRHLVAVLIILALFVLAPIGLYTIGRWMFVPPG